MFELIKKAFYEWVKTFSNEKSFLSSKRIERFSIFGVMLVSTAYYLWNNITKCEFPASELMIVVAGWMGYSGFSIVQGRKDKQKEENNG